MSCPICGRDTQHRYRPFCSRRCADIDLGRWMTGAYAIPAEEEERPDSGPEDTASDAPSDSPGRPRTRH